MIELVNWLMAVTGWSMSTLFSVMFFIGFTAITVVPKLIAAWRIKRERIAGNPPPAGDNDIISLIQKQAPGVFSTSELAQISKFSRQLSGHSGAKVTLSGSELVKTLSGGGGSEEDQVLQHLDRNSGSASHSGDSITVDDLRITLGEDGKPAHVVVNGQVIDLRDSAR